MPAVFSGLLLKKNVFLFFLLVFNAVPVFGAFAWNWHVFDLVFLYWMENLVIGFFMLLRMFIRPYKSPLEMIIPLPGMAFFTLHYGLFCYLHGVFVIYLFGREFIGDASVFDLPLILPGLIESRQLYWPFVSLAAFQMVDWMRENREKGFGASGIYQLATRPYRRVVVMHLATMVGAFPVALLDSPVLGLLLLILFKTAMDIYHWKKDAGKEKQPVLDAKERKNIDQFLEKCQKMAAEKGFKIESLEQMNMFWQYRLYKSVVGMMDGKQEMMETEAYLAEKIRLANAEATSVQYDAEILLSSQDI